MFLTIIILPLIGTVFAGFFGKIIGNKGAALITSLYIFLAFCFSFYAFLQIGLGNTICLIQLSPWIVTEFFQLKWGFLFDSLTCVMLIVVTSISSLVHIYSIEYMKEDPHLARFMSYLSLFTFFMLILVTSDNFLQMFVGWEGVGLCSYLLINFWYGRIQANKAALKAMIVNRIGDFGLALGVFGIYFFFESLDYSVVFSLIPYFSEQVLPFSFWKISILDFIGFCLFIGAVGKSAQIGLHTWLPDAMEGPTPVSALIHAATMVTAGVFLLCRCSIILEYAPTVKFLIILAGGMTAFLAATTGLLQNDLKRVIAYSTCSQLGYMVFAAGLSSYNVSVFHLSNHAFFKALLFLGAGAVIHAMNDEQDMRKMGGLVKILPFTYATIFIGSLALAGFPFLTGFYSKDIILEVAFGSFLIEGRFVHTLGSLVAFLTAFYSIRLLVLTFLRPANGLKNVYEHAHEPSLNMSFPLFILAFGSIFIGYLSKDMMIGLGSDFWGNSLFILPTNSFILEGEWLNTSVKLVPLFSSFLGVGLGYFLYLYRIHFLFHLKLTSVGKFLYLFFNRKWFFDKVYNENISQNLLNTAYYHTYKNLDRGFLEILGPHGISYTLIRFCKGLKDSNSIFVFNFLFWILFSFFLTIAVLVKWSFLISICEFNIMLLLVWIIIVFEILPKYVQK